VERRRTKRAGEDGAAPRRTPRDEALRLLKRRPRTRVELARELRHQGHDSVEIDETLDALEAAGYVDDEELSRHYITTRAARLQHGRERLLAELEQRGVSREVAERSWARAVDSGEIDPPAQLRGAIRRRLRGRRSLDSGDFARVYNALLRAGYAAEEVRRELEPHLTDEARATFHDEEINDDLP